MADDLPVELKITHCHSSQVLMRTSRRCVRLKKLVYALVLLPPSKKDSMRRAR